MSRRRHQGRSATLVETADLCAGHPEESARPAQAGPLNFSNPAERAAHVAAFLAWLPADLRAAPRIAWDRVPSKVIGYVLRSSARHPDAHPIVLAVGAAHGAVGEQALFAMCGGMTRLLTRLRAVGGMADLGHLRERRLWETFVDALQAAPGLGGRTPHTLAAGIVAELGLYDSLTSNHLPHYLETLDDAERAVLQPYVLPPLPIRFLERSGLRAASDDAARRRRKEQADILTPLHPFLVQVAQCRKQAAERLLAAIRVQQERVVAGAVTLPHAFVHESMAVQVTPEAATVAALGMALTPVLLHLTLWDRCSWAEAHGARMSAEQRRLVQKRERAYAPGPTTSFVECHNPPQDLLWFGDIIAARVLGGVDKTCVARRKLAQDLGEPTGFRTKRTGLLRSGGRDGTWLSMNVRAGELVFEPESLYRGILYGAALATVALTSGCRVSELLQVSNTRWDLVEVDESRQGTPTGQRITVVLQHLLPKGSRTERQRQPFLISPQALPLLTEIGQALRARHGEIPIVHPTRSTKEEHLPPEPYLFQWAASADGRLGLLDLEDVGTLLRFLFHGLQLTTAKGDRIRIATHLCRHVFATSARHHYQVPPEAIAWMLHHRSVPRGRGPAAAPVATLYYSEMPAEQRLALLHDAQVAMAGHGGPAPLQLPSEQDLRAMDEDLRAIFEDWGTIGPTTFGFCKAGMCVRPHNRALCIGCPFLVADHRRLGSALRWRKIYLQAAERLEDEGQPIEARQKRREVEHLEGIITMMRLQRATLRAGAPVPALWSLAAPEEDEEACDV